LLFFFVFSSGSVAESQGAAQFHLHPGQSPSFSLHFMPSAFPCLIQFFHRRLCVRCRVLPPVDLVFTTAGYALVFDSFSRDLLACSSCIGASVRPQDCVSSFFAQARAADSCQPLVSISTRLCEKPSLEFGCFGRHQSCSASFFILLLVFYSCCG
jgi:hypothetical protein